MSEPLDVAARSAKQWKVSSHHGAGEWLAERFTSLVLIPLTLWGAWAATQVVSGGYATAWAFAKVPLNAGLILATVIVSAWHMYMGLKAVIDDYIATPGLRGFFVFIDFLLCLAAVLATGGALWLVHTGSLGISLMSGGAA